MLTFIAAALMLATPNTDPIRLQANPHPGGVEVQVIGLSSTPVTARYRLEVSSGGSGNRSTQAGRARLTPGEEAVLVRMTVSSGPGGDWSARLFVEPENGAPYEREFSGRP